ncbi:DJ-1 family glyoxalase III [Parasphaerochaeta coccoides]|uniref:DJ-1 family protein n=1 Tax=Parasphaerochaeta coccoides (strain ATCC BAA-1237 / DSM 17374 / SPN1) TaxID=760011 RepID=F4GHY7_PARC1|nr:DJ-1 family glyoxalase III [Parasphaerochaeta coccoides]AEC02100.1 DJ-1 family protein [Parasphaerochaeta coccoides DSM 17374]
MNIPVVIIPLAESFEEIEAVAPIDILRRAGVRVIVAGLDGVSVVGTNGLTVQCDMTLAEAREIACDAVVLPGGMPGARNLAASADVIALLDATRAAGGYLAAICASPAYVLGAHGYLDGHKAVGYPGTENQAPSVAFGTQAVLTDGKVITSRGAGTAIDFALAIVTALMGSEKATQLAASLIYRA